MKKTVLILTLLVCVILTGCNGDVAEPPVVKTEEPTIEAPKAEEDYFFELNGTKIVIGNDMAPIVQALGEPSSYFESNSCAFQGLDKVYTWGSVIIRTYPENEKDYVLSVELKDDSVSTPEGISLGSTPEEAENIYGAPQQKTNSALIYKKGSTVLTFLITNNEITAITYSKEV